MRKKLLGDSQSRYICMAYHYDRLGSVIGIPKYAGDCTIRNKRLNYDRVLMEVDLTNLVPSKIQFEGRGDIVQTPKIRYMRPFKVLH